jgi:hypothetical protein
MSYLQPSPRARCSKFDGCPSRPSQGEAGAGRDARHAGKVGADGSYGNNQIGARLVLVVQSTTAAHVILSADWYRTMAPLLGFATKHRSSERMLTHDEFSALLGHAGFRRIRSAPGTFIPREICRRSLHYCSWHSMQSGGALDWILFGVAFHYAPEGAETRLATRVNS